MRCLICSRFKVLFFTLLLFLNLTAVAQTEQYIGLVGGKVVGASYTLQYKRWGADANLGWLTGFKGGYGSVNGLYRVFTLEKNVGSVWQDGLTCADIGLGVFAQGYTSPTQRQKELAEKLNYNAPIGVQMVVSSTGKFKALPLWNFGVHLRIPFIIVNGKSNSDEKKASHGELLLSWVQLSVQYQIGEK